MQHSTCAQVCLFFLPLKCFPLYCVQCQYARLLNLSANVHSILAVRMIGIFPPEMFSILDRFLYIPGLGIQRAVGLSCQWVWKERKIC